MNKELKLWKYLIKTLKPLKDNNKTAKKIFNYFSKIDTSEENYHRGFYEGSNIKTRCL